MGEPYFHTRDVPAELIDYEGRHHTEAEHFDILTEEGFELEYIAPAAAMATGTGTPASGIREGKRRTRSTCAHMRGGPMYMLRPER